MLATRLSRRRARGSTSTACSALSRQNEAASALSGLGTRSHNGGFRDDACHRLRASLGSPNEHPITDVDLLCVRTSRFSRADCGLLSIRCRCAATMPSEAWTFAPLATGPVSYRLSSITALTASFHVSLGCSSR